ncbi:MAG: 4Fe-4S dicluster domain-containing protein [Chloroflexi bacterium]|nr:4Fe-4S dicluster domain-containing protein [Chloroflexota bacterium]
MRFGTMFSDIVSSLLRRPITELYPVERRATPDRLRGQLHWDWEACTGCSLCAKECPAQAVDLIVIDKKAKQFAMRYHTDRCIYCAQCVVNCRFGCLEMSSDEWELASANKDPFTVYYGDEANVEAALADRAD